MSHSKRVRFAFFAFFTVVTLALFSWAQNVKVQGLIKGRSGDTMILQTSDSPSVIVLLTDRHARSHRCRACSRRAENRCRWPR